MQTSRTDAIDYFYPKGGELYPHGCWGGYARWFEPCIPGRIGKALITNIFYGLKGSKEHRQAAIAILQATHTKTVSHQKGVEPFDVECKPNAEANKAIEFLRAIPDSVPPEGQPAAENL